MVRDVERELQRLRNDIAELRGAGGVVRVNGTIDMGRRPIVNVLQSRDDHSVCPRHEIKANTPYTDSTSGYYTAGTLLDMNGNKIINLGDPTAAQDAATKAYVDAQVGGISTGAGGGNALMYFDDLTPDLTETGTAWTLTQTPTGDDDVQVYLNGVLLLRVPSAPDSQQYTLSGTTLTTGRTLVTGESLEAMYTISVTTPYFDDLTPNLNETGTTWTLAYMPIPDAGGEPIALFLNGQKIREVISGPTSVQYTLDGQDVVTGRTLTAGETLRAVYSMRASLVFNDLTPLLTETGTSWTLAFTPTAVSQIALYLNGVRLRRVTGAPATDFEYRLVLPTAITTGRSLVAGESLEAIYNT